MDVHQVHPKNMVMIGLDVWTHPWTLRKGLRSVPDARDPRHVGTTGHGDFMGLNGNLVDFCGDSLLVGDSSLC